MPNVIFVAPFFLETTLNFVEAAARLPGVRLGLISQDPEEKLPHAIRARLAAHFRVADGLSTDQLAHAIRMLAGRLGPIDRLLGTLEELQVPLGALRDHFEIPGMGATVANNFRDKSVMKGVLAAHGLPCAAHRLATSGEAVRRFAAEVGFPIIVKPPDGAGARQTFRLDDTAQLDAWLATHGPAPGREILCEEFLTGQERSYDSVCIDGRVVWSSINHYFPSPLEVMENRWIQWCVLLPREVDDPAYAGIRAAGPAALAALGMKNGLSHMEWFLKPDGRVAISEVGARPPGAQFTTLISYAHDFDLNAAWARLMVYDQFDPPKRPYAAGVAYLRGQGRGRVVAVHGLDVAQKEIGGLAVEVRLPAPGQPPSSSYEGEGYVIVRHPETAVVEQALRRLVTLIRVELG